MTEKFSLQLALVLPGVPDERDSCIDRMDCSTCATVIEHALGRLDGVLEASVSYAAERLRLEYDTEKVQRKAIVQRLAAMGYGVLEAHHEAPWHVEYRELIVSAVAGALLL